jgi:SAM-dependent methyltransferase
MVEFERGFTTWLDALERAQLADLTFAELSRALRALSSTYVERRSRIREGAVFSGAGKRAAFALYYAPLHFLLLREVGAALRVGQRQLDTVVDLGCGTGAAGAVAGTAVGAVEVVGIDRHPWALAQAEATYRHFGLRPRTRRGDVTGVPWPAGPSVLVAAFVLDELDERAREVALRRLIERGSRGDVVLVVEPLARFVAPWWNDWARRFEEEGGRADQWRFRVDLPPILAKLDRAAGLNHRELTARTLYLNGPVDPSGSSA